MVCLGGFCGGTGDGELGDEGVEEGGSGGIREETGGEEVAPGHEGVGVASFHKRVKSICRAKILTSSISIHPSSPQCRMTGEVIQARHMVRKQ